MLYGLSLAVSIPVRGCSENLDKSNQQLVVDEHATKFSNYQINTIDFRAEMPVEREELEGSKTYDQSQIVQAATEFSNNKPNDATINGNSDEKRRRERDLNPRGPHGPQAI